MKGDIAENTTEIVSISDTLLSESTTNNSQISLSKSNETEQNEEQNKEE
jgi:hypothetical protein